MELENRDEEKERQARRSERLERMRKEKQRQERKRRMLKKYLPLGAGAAAMLVLVIVIAVVLIGGKTNGAQQSANENGVSETADEAVMSGAAGQSGTAGAAEQDGDGKTGDTAADGLQGDETAKDGAQTADGSAAGNALNSGTTDGENGSGQETQANGATETTVYSFETTPDTVEITSEEVISSNAILIDESTDEIVASKGALERISPASMTKVLTVLVAAEQIEEADLDDKFTITLEITDYAYVNDCSCVGFLDGENVTVRDLFYGTILPSGADAAVGLATYVAGSHEAFVDLMNEKLKELGLAATSHVTNCVGLYDEKHYCTVYDMAVIMKAAMQNELCREVLSAHTYTTVPTEEHPEGMVISNWFLRRIEDKDTGGEVIGAKTGFVVQSRNCAVSYGSFAGGTPYICVTAGSSSSWRCIYDHVEIYTRYVPEG